MQDISLHILDIVENSTRAGATKVIIKIIEDIKNDWLIIEIIDNGKGMSKEMIKNALNPFFTTKTVRKIGLGLPFLAQAVEMTGGNMEIESEEGKGTTIKAKFGYSHIDRQPLGDIASTIITLICGNENIDFHYMHTKDEQEFELNTEEIRKELDGVPINNPEVLNYIRNSIIE
jgi:signal transduction histidine kinase